MTTITLDEKTLDEKKTLFKKKLARREAVWATILLVGLVAITGYSGWFGWTNGLEVDLLDKGIVDLLDKGIKAIFSILASVGLFLVVAKLISDKLERTWLKPYWIEDNGNVVRLYGAVNLMRMSDAYRDVLRGKQGYVVVKDAFDHYGCTIAAVKATEDEIKSKEELTAMGFPVETMC